MNNARASQPDLMTAPEDTIFALSSGAGRAGVAVIRISGPRARFALERIAGGCPPPRLASLRRLRGAADGELIDEALVLWFPAPRSETGEDLAELQVHGSRAVITRLLGELAAIEGLRPAEPGEFVRRAFWSGKLDLTAVEGLADLIDAETETQRRQAVAQAGGVLARLYEGWRHRLLETQALVEAAIDFADEADVASSAVADARSHAATVLDGLDRHLAGAHRGEIRRDGFRVVLAGPPNAGKSSLLNALARRDVAIVSEEAGTTRDLIEVRLDLAGVPVVLTDTAGLRDAAGRVEAEGIRRSIQSARAADLLLWIVDTNEPMQEPPLGLTQRQGASGDWLKVLNKIDLVSPDLADALARPSGALGVSALRGDGLEELIAALAARALAAAGTVAAAVPTNERQRVALDGCRTHLERFLRAPAAEVELRAEDLRLAAAELGRLTGRIDPEAVLDRIFSRFCIGK